MDVIATLMDKLLTTESSRAMSVIYDSSSTYSKVSTIKYYLNNCCPIQINIVSTFKPKNGIHICKCVHISKILPILSLKDKHYALLFCV